MRKFEGHLYDCSIQLQIRTEPSTQSASHFCNANANANQLPNTQCILKQQTQTKRPKDQKTKTPHQRPDLLGIGLLGLVLLPAEQRPNLDNLSKCRVFVKGALERTLRLRYNCVIVLRRRSLDKL